MCGASARGRSAPRCFLLSAGFGASRSSTSVGQAWPASGPDLARFRANIGRTLPNVVHISPIWAGSGLNLAKVGRRLSKKLAPDPTFGRAGVRCCARVGQRWPNMAKLRQHRTESFRQSWGYTWWRLVRLGPSLATAEQSRTNHVLKAHEPKVGRHESGAQSERLSVIKRCTVRRGRARCNREEETPDVVGTAALPQPAASAAHHRDRRGGASCCDGARAARSTIGGGACVTVARSRAGVGWKDLGVSEGGPCKERASERCVKSGAADVYLLIPACCWPPTRRLLLAAQHWPHTIGRLVLASCCWPRADPPPDNLGGSLIPELTIPYHRRIVSSRSLRQPRSSKFQG